MLVRRSSQNPLNDFASHRKRGVRQKFGVLVFCFVVCIFVGYTLLDINQSKRRKALRFRPQKYLINTSKCRIPDEDPFNDDIKEFYSPMPYIKCCKKNLLTFLQREQNVVTLNVNQSLLSSYSHAKITCCYSNVSRPSNNSESHVEVSFCLPFQESVRIFSDTVVVKCHEDTGKEVFSNVHAVIDQNRILGPKNRPVLNPNSAFNVLLVGIDSISKLNLVRTMPKTHQFLENYDFVNLKGYNKIDDNTFQNLMAILTGKTMKQVYDHCHPPDRPMDNCDFIWEKFRKIGYITAYGEDEIKMNTFNYNRKGFNSPPTDYYFRPYFLAAEKLVVKKYYGMTYCSGPETSGERILNLAKDFTIVLKNYPKFSLWWMNSFSHENLNFPSTLDEKVETFLRDLYDNQQNTIFVFFSDHGFRFGKSRYTHTGWLEERLPFIYVSLPTSFKKKYIRKYSNFILNAERLTTPFDIHMTLQEILYLADNHCRIEASQACPKCRSLFDEVDEARTCKDASIDQHWCLCSGHSYIDTDLGIVSEISDFVAAEVNSIISKYPEAKKCAHYKVRSVTSAGMSESYLNDYNKTVHYFLVLFEADPEAMFEATVEASLQTPGTFRLLGEISRTDRYAPNSFCVEDLALKKYCYCPSKVWRLF